MTVPDPAAALAQVFVARGPRRFSRLRPDSFTWQAEETPPGGRPWIRQRFEAIRLS